MEGSFKFVTPAPKHEWNVKSLTEHCRTVNSAQHGTSVPSTAWQFTSSPTKRRTMEKDAVNTGHWIQVAATRMRIAGTSTRAWRKRNSKPEWMRNSIDRTKVQHSYNRSTGSTNIQVTGHHSTTATDSNSQIKKSMFGCVTPSSAVKLLPDLTENTLQSEPCSLNGLTPLKHYITEI